MKRAAWLGSLLWATVVAAQTQGAPVVPPAAPWTPTAPVVRTLASGGTAWVAQRPGVPLVSVVVDVPAGAMRDPAGQRGLAWLVAQAVEEGGAGARTGTQVLEAFERLGAELSCGVDQDSAGVSITVPSLKLEPALKLLVEVLSTPRFEPAAVEALRKRQAAELTQDAVDPQAIAERLLLAQLYGTGPRGHRARGVLEEVGGLEVAAVQAFHAAHWGSAGMQFSVAGDVTPERFQALMNALAPKPWGSAAPAVLPASTTTAPEWVAWDKPGAPQTVVVMARPFGGALHPALPATELAATVLGGSFTSRLMQNIRERHGYAYGAGARVEVMRQDGRLTLSSNVRTDVTAEALKEMLFEAGNLGTMSAEELEKAKRLRVSGLVEQLGGGLGEAGTHSVNQALGLGPAALATHVAAWRTVELAQALEAGRAFEPKGMTVVLVGDRARLEKPLAKLFPGQAIRWVGAVGK